MDELKKILEKFDILNISTSDPKELFSNPEHYTQTKEDAEKVKALKDLLDVFMKEVSYE